MAGKFWSEQEENELWARRDDAEVHLAFPGRTLNAIQKKLYAMRDEDSLRTI